MSTVIKIENVSKQYRLGSIGTDTLKGDIQRWWHSVRGLPDPTLMIGTENTMNNKVKAEAKVKGLSTLTSTSDFVWALKDINFEVKQGEVLGIIGKNGAGKSTLLKLLSRVTAPSTGNIKVKGRIASLLEVGTGFHPELTGKENIFLNGAILGMTKQEIHSKFDEIVEFAGVSKYIETPVKRYSSGMYVRLAFAVAAHLEPEILIVDEVLAVGDIDFQNKALGKMQDISTKEGRTVLFVSHNMIAVKNLCTRAIVLRNGTMKFDGSVEDGIDFYLNENKIRKDNFSLGEVINNLPDDVVFKLISVTINQARKEITDFAYSDIPIDIEIDFTIKEKTLGFRLFIDLVDNKDTLIFRSFNDENETAISVVNTGTYKSIVQIPSNLLGPIYYEIRIQAGIYNQRMCMPVDAIKIPIKVTNLIYNKAYPSDIFRQKIAPILCWSTITI